MLTAQEVYSTVRILIQKLNQAGEKEWAERLYNALVISSSQLEILGMIRLQLRNLKKTELPARLEVQPEVNAVISAIDKIYGS